MNNEQSTTQQHAPNLDLAALSYNGKHKVIAGALAQVVKGLEEMKSRIGSDKETDEYKKCLYPKLRDLSTQIVEKFKPMLDVSADVDKQVRYYNLFGFEGMVRRDRFGRFPFVPKFRPATSYDYANFGDYLKICKQRCDYILTRNVPQRYVNNPEEGAAFNKLKADVTNFSEFLRTTVEPKWTDAVKDARTAGGQTVQQNIQARSVGGSNDEDVPTSNQQPATASSGRRFVRGDNRSPPTDRRTTTGGQYQRSRPFGKFRDGQNYNARRNNL